MQLTLSVSHPAREQGHQVRAMGVSSAGRAHFSTKIAMHTRAQASKRLAKAKRASHGPRVSLHAQAKARARKTRGNPKERKVRTKVPKAYTKAKHRELVSQVLKTRNSDIQESALTYTTDVSWNDGWNGDEWNYWLEF